MATRHRLRRLRCLREINVPRELMIRPGASWNGSIGPDSAPPTFLFDDGPISDRTTLLGFCRSLYVGRRRKGRTGCRTVDRLF